MAVERAADKKRGFFRIPECPECEPLNPGINHLTKLLKNAGYDLIGTTLNAPNLGASRRGLKVHGRDAWHQVDTMGVSRWTRLFNVPMRLFLVRNLR
jgi:hypothetical protein